MLPLAVPLDRAVALGNAIPLNDDTVTPGLLGFGFFVALAVATFLLLRSMNKRMRNIQAPREEDLKQQEWERAQQAKAEKAADAPRKD
ncbi:hypothetical protein Acsp04_02650 [Actinomadura sp. NBRC 104425]|uniref:hypothetical protein n=1 Tax=Actinomadura sp. NBRC 104425 TaxID=3032204 RepID=UPI0024A509F1|nr:hypothetical protein [Actinomadura sp. NBRC 104425]GLZ10030.1 hypothetical protein Acsp04_02650 [Actinomadura sp. NBRC 104425]